MKLFNLIGTFGFKTIPSEGDRKVCWIEAEGNKYYVPSYDLNKFSLGELVKFCSFVSNSVDIDNNLTVAAYGHAPCEVSNIVSYGIGDSAGLNEDEICFTKSDGSYHTFTLV